MVRGVQSYFQKIRDQAPKLTRTDADIKQAVEAWWDDPVAAEAQYGHISEWRTEQVTDMKELFEHVSEFNEDLSRWDVSAVTNMSCMFLCARSFNQDLSAWDVSAVTNMESMFESAKSFNQDLSAWDVSAVTDMGYMFDYASSLANRPSWCKGTWYK